MDGPPLPYDAATVSPPGPSLVAPGRRAPVGCGHGRTSSVTDARFTVRTRCLVGPLRRAYGVGLLGEHDPLLLGRGTPHGIRRQRRRRWPAGRSARRPAAARPPGRRGAGGAQPGRRAARSRAHRSAAVTACATRPPARRLVTATAARKPTRAPTRVSTTRSVISSPRRLVVGELRDEQRHRGHADTAEPVVAGDQRLGTEGVEGEAEGRPGGPARGGRAVRWPRTAAPRRCCRPHAARRGSRSGSCWPGRARRR